MKAVKANKVYTITEAEKAHYVAMGFDIKDDDGTVVAYGKGKTVPYEQYAELKAAHEKLMTIYEAKDCSDELSELSVDELKAYAEAHGIDIGQASSQDGILKKIRVAQKA